MGRTIALTAALAGALLLAWLGTRTPGPEPVARAPVATAFQTDLAMVDIHRIARAPHPTGSAANAVVLRYLQDRMTALGLSPATQSGLAIETRERGGETWVIGGGVVNVVGVLPGKDRTAPALALMAHYDSVPASPGAADDATGVAVALDVVRALKAKGTPERDVIIILTDGEEAGLLGARLFFAEHPLRKRIGLLINLESRGGGGRANMFQTGPGNGALIPVFARTAVSPISNSLAVFLYERMPNDTDFTVSKDLGIRGLNFAFIGRQFDYHSPTSTPANLDQGSVRHMGEQTLAAAADLAFAERLPGKAPDAVYSQTFGDHLLAYPAWGGWVAWLLAAGLIALGWWRGRRLEAFRLADVARGAGAAVFLLLAGALLLHLARRATGVGFGFMEQRPLLAQWALWETTLAVLSSGLLLLVPSLLARERVRLWLAGAGLLGGILCLAFAGWDPMGAGLGVATALVGYAAFGKPARLPGAWLGVLLTGLVAGLALQIALPAVAFLVVWPLVLAGLGAAASLMATRLDLSRSTGLALLAALGGGWLAVFFHVVSQGLDLPDLLALFLWLGAMLVWPLAWPGAMPRLTLAPAVALLTLGLVLVGVVRFNDPWTARHPLATSVFHVLDDQTGKAMLIATPEDLDPWSRAALGAAGGPIGKQTFRPLIRRPVWAAADGTGPTGQLPLSIVSQNGAVDISLPPLTSPAAGTVTLDFRATAPITLTQVDGRPVTAKVAAGQWVHIRTTALRLNWVRFIPAGPGSVEARAAVIDSAWPKGAKPLPPRPSNVMPFDRSDSSVVISGAQLSW
jgi:hypothetical protein